MHLKHPKGNSYSCVIFSERCPFFVFLFLFFRFFFSFQFVRLFICLFQECLFVVAYENAASETVQWLWCDASIAIFLLAILISSVVLFLIRFRQRFSFSTVSERDSIYNTQFRMYILLLYHPFNGIHLFIASVGFLYNSKKHTHEQKAMILWLYQVQWTSWANFETFSKRKCTWHCRFTFRFIESHHWSAFGKIHSSSLSFSPTSKNMQLFHMFIMYIQIEKLFKLRSNELTREKLRIELKKIEAKQIADSSSQKCFPFLWIMMINESARTKNKFQSIHTHFICFHLSYWLWKCMRLHGRLLLLKLIWVISEYAFMKKKKMILAPLTKNKIKRKTYTHATCSLCERRKK